MKRSTVFLLAFQTREDVVFRQASSMQVHDERSQFADGIGRRQRSVQFRQSFRMPATARSYSARGIGRLGSRNPCLGRPDPCDRERNSLSHPTQAASVG